MALAACDVEEPTPTQLAPEAAPALSVSLGANGLATTDATEFADAVRGVSNENELLVWFRGANESALSHDALADTRGTVVGLSSAQAARTRSGLKARPANAQARQAVVGMLQAHGIQPYSSGNIFPYVAIRVPDAALDAVSHALLNHPNIDFVEANQRRAAYTLEAVSPVPDAQDDTDIKHTRHFVPDAWTYTRGSSNTAVGIMDSGLIYDLAAGVGHPDAADFGGHGIQARGFVDDMEWFGECTGAQALSGECPAWDDNWGDTLGLGGHGTRMAGFVGEADNSIGYQGLMPDGRTYAMKVGFNTYLPFMGKCRIDTGGGVIDKEAAFCVEADDFIAAIDWAASNQLEVVSMSWFLEKLQASEKAALQAAYEDHDVLLLAALGNDFRLPASQDELVRQSYIMGIGSVDAYGRLLQSVNIQHLEAAGHYGWTITAVCLNQTEFCSLGNETANTLYRQVQGTSAGTAIAAGIAGLVRDRFPALTAPQVRSLLAATARGDSTRMLDAEWAVANTAGLRARVLGTSFITETGSYRWSANTSGGSASGYSYLWQVSDDGGQSWQTLGTSSESNYLYVDEFHPSPFTVRMRVTNDGRVLYRSLHVTVDIDTCTPIPPAVTC